MMPDPTNTIPTALSDTMTKHMTVQLQPGKDENISQELAILAWSGAVNIAPGTYTVDNEPLMATTDDSEDA